MFKTQTIPLQRPAIYTLPSDLWHDRQCQGLSIYCHRWYSALTHWGRVAHICVGKLINIGSDNGLSPGRRQAIIWTNAGILLIGHLGTNFNEILIGIQTFSFKKMHLKMSSAKWRPFCLGLIVLILVVLKLVYLGITKSMPWLLMPWFPALPRHQRLRRSVCRIGFYYQER